VIQSSNRQKYESSCWTTNLYSATSQALYALKPVSFRYKREIDPTQALNFGRIAEEAEKVNPALVCAMYGTILPTALWAEKPLDARAQTICNPIADGRHRKLSTSDGNILPVAVH
jgi:hypothetical protein